MEKPLFSILTVGCNGARFVSDWAESVLAQTYRPLEVIYVDDGSKDNTAGLIKKKKRIFAKAGISLGVYHRLRKKLYYGGGLYYATGKAKGEFFGILDIDDALKPGSVDYIMDLYERYPQIGYIYTSFDVHDCKMRFVKHGFSSAPVDGQTILSEGLELGRHVYSHFRTFSRRVPNYLTVCPIKGKYAVDQFMGLTLEERAYGMFAERVCYEYRSGCTNTISSRFGAQRRRYWYKMMKQFAALRKKRKTKVYKIKSHK